MRYKKGYKYQLAQYESIDVKELETFAFNGKFIYLSRGKLVLYSGYAWDGPSGLTIDTKNSLRASAFHDALYQLIGLKILGIQQRAIADEVFYKILRADGMSKIRAWIWYQAVKRAGKKYALKTNPILIAP